MRKVVGCLATMVLATGLTVAEGMDSLLSGRGAKYGPIGNEEDQFRIMCGSDSQIAFGETRYYDELLACGFNLHYYRFGDRYDFAEGHPVEMHGLLEEKMKALHDRFLADGVMLAPELRIADNKVLKRTFPRITREGVRNAENLDAGNATARERAVRAAEHFGSCLRHPVIGGVQVASEIRDRCHPSFTPEMKAAYRAETGCDVPEEILNNNQDKIGRNPPRWKTRKDFPKDRVVEDDDPILRFYVWSWLKGDGWCDVLTGIGSAFRKGRGAHVFTEFSPWLRTPPLWEANGDIDFLRNWEYPYPEPYKMSYMVSELQSRARKDDNGVNISVQAIAYRSRLAPFGEHPENEPEWTRKYPKTGYPTVPPDIIREGLWSVFSRKVDGIGVYGMGALWDLNERYPGDYYSPTNNGYRCANPQTRDVVRDLFQTVAVPLGPLFRAIPERAPKVALVEGYASMILGGRLYWDTRARIADYGTAATAANLMPATLTEAEIRDFDIPDSVETLIMSECDVLTRKCHERIAAFKARGGRIVADADLCPALKADALLPPLERAYPKTVSDHDDGVAVPKTLCEVREFSMKDVAAKLKELVGPKAAPYADSSNPDLVLHVRSYRTSDYLFAINDRRTYGAYVGPWKRIKEAGCPNAGTVVIGRETGAVYDLVRHERVPFVSERGQTRIDLSYRTNDGKVLLLTARPLGGLKVAVDGTTIVVTSADRDVLIPIRIDGVRAKPFHAVVRNGRYVHDFGRAPVGKVSVLSLANGERY